jgi:hypothetical protein
MERRCAFRSWTSPHGWRGLILVVFEEEPESGCDGLERSGVFVKFPLGLVWGEGESGVERNHPGGC